MADNGAVSFQVDGKPGPVAVETAHTVVRAAQEALTNAVKYAPGATRTMTLTFTADTVRLTVANGPATTSPPTDIAGGTGMGLVGMRERVALLGGTMHAGPDTEGRGWRVDVEAPR
jgi:signal transduction histidine kinase